MKSIQQASGNILFRNQVHRERFQNTVRNTGHQTNSIPLTFAAAVFLLTADSQLWYKTEHVIHSVIIDFRQINVRGMSPDAYTLFQTAKDLYSDFMHITLSELADPELINDELFRLIIHSFIVK